MGAWVNNGPTVFQNIVFFSPQQLSKPTIPEEMLAASNSIGMQCNAEHRTGISLSSSLPQPSSQCLGLVALLPIGLQLPKHKMQSAIHPSYALFLLSLVNPFPRDGIIHWISTTMWDWLFPILLHKFLLFFSASWFIPPVDSSSFFPPKFKYPKILKTIFFVEIFGFAIMIFSMQN